MSGKTPRSRQSPTITPTPRTPTRPGSPDRFSPSTSDEIGHGGFDLPHIENSMIQTASADPAMGNAAMVAMMRNQAPRAEMLLARGETRDGGRGLGSGISSGPTSGSGTRDTFSPSTSDDVGEGPRQPRLFGDWATA